MFSQRFLHILANHQYDILERVAWTGLLLIAAGIYTIFMLLTNQEMLYSQANLLIYWRPQLTYII